MAHLKNHSNVYAETLGSLFDQTPKAVLAAIAVSALTCGGDWLDEDETPERLLAEWWTLHRVGIVPQKPPRPARITWQD